MKEQIFQYYATTRDLYESYHNHKEVSAWAGLALYVVFCGALLGPNPPASYHMLFAGSLTFLVLVVAVLIFIYVRTQLRMKDRGGAISSAASYLLAEVVRDSSATADKYLTIEESGVKEEQAAHVLPAVLLKKAEVFDIPGRGRHITRWMVYGLLCVTTLGSLGFVWLRALA